MPTMVYSPGADEGDKVEDGMFDIITEEEVSRVSDSDSFATACSSVHGQQEAAQLYVAHLASKYQPQKLT